VEDEEGSATVEWASEGEHEEDEEARKASRRGRTRVWVPSRSRVHKAPSPSTGPPSAEGENQTPSTPSTSTGTLGRHRPRIHPSRPQRSTKAKLRMLAPTHTRKLHETRLPAWGTPHGHTGSETGDTSRTHTSHTHTYRALGT
jgi:hypothetical protein